MKSNIYEAMALLANAIKEKYPLFSAAYPMAKADFKKGIILSYDKKEWVALTDTEGNYFYIRIDENIPVGQVKGGGFTDCDLSVTENYNCTLVCITSSDYDEIELKDAITTEILNQQHVVTQASLDPVSILTKELKGLDQQIIDRAIASLYERTLISVSFRYARIFSSSKCIIEPCKTC